MADQPRRGPGDDPRALVVSVLVSPDRGGEYGLVPGSRDLGGHYLPLGEVLRAVVNDQVDELLPRLASYFLPTVTDISTKTSSLPWIAVRRAGTGKLRTIFLTVRVSP